MSVAHVGQKENLLYKQIEDYILARINCSMLRPGDSIPPETELGRQFEVSRVTVRRAISELVDDGILTRIQGKGTFIAKSYSPVILRHMVSYSLICAEQGIKPSYNVLYKSFETPSPEVRTFFEISEDQQVIRLKRLLFANDMPVVLESSYFPPRLSFLIHEPLEASLYRLLADKYGIYPSKGLREVSIFITDEETGQLLNIPLKTPMIRLSINVFDLEGRPLQKTEQYVRTDVPELFRYFG